jgi:hypothetical protein
MSKNTLQTPTIERRIRHFFNDRREYRRQRREHDMAMSIPGVAAEHDAMVRRSGNGCPFCD